MPNQDAVDYVREGFKSKVDKAVLKKNLLAAQYSEQDVDDAIRLVEQEPPALRPALEERRVDGRAPFYQEKKQSGTTYILLGFFAALVFGAGAVYVRGPEFFPALAPFFGEESQKEAPIEPSIVEIAARDTGRVADLRGAELALREYAAVNGRYPAAKNWNEMARALRLSELPESETSHRYWVSPEGGGYVIGVRLEDPAHPALENDSDGTVLGIVCADPVYCLGDSID